MPWEEMNEYIHSGHRSPEEFQPDSLRTIVFSEDEGIKAVVGKPKGKDATEIQTYVFDKTKGWTLDKATAWFSQHHKNELVREHVSAILPFKVLEKIVGKPLRIRGIAMTAGMSRNFNIYTPEELQTFTNKLVSVPVYVEHVAVPNVVGKVTRTEWDGQNLWYEAEIYDDEVAEKIRKGLIQHVSIGADYETIDILDGKIPHGLHNAELSLVAVPGIPETNVQIMEKFRAQKKVKEQGEYCVFCGEKPAEVWVACCFDCFEKLPISESKKKELLERQRKMREQQAFEPIIAGEYILGFYQDASAFLPEHFNTVWLDKENGILAIVGKLKIEPGTERVQSIFFAKEKMWDENKIRDWLLLHPHYMAPAGASASLQTPLKEREKMSERKLVERVWTRRYINDLPDSAFAVILSGGQKDEEGKTVPRDLRKFSYKNRNGRVDLPHLRNANTRVPQSEISEEQKKKAMAVLGRVKKKLDIGMSAEEAKIVEQAEQEKPEEIEFEVEPEPTIDELIASVENAVEQVNDAIEGLTARVENLEKAFAAKLQDEGGSIAEKLLKNSRSMISVEDAMRMIHDVLPSAMVERSWGFGPQRLCQELRGVILKFRGRVKQNG